MDKNEKQYLIDQLNQIQQQAAYQQNQQVRQMEQQIYQQQRSKHYWDWDQKNIFGPTVMSDNEIINEVINRGIVDKDAFMNLINNAKIQKLQKEVEAKQEEIAKLVGNKLTGKV
jgi:hypothetical protein